MTEFEHGETKGFEEEEAIREFCVCVCVCVRVCVRVCGIDLLLRPRFITEKDIGLLHKM